MVTKTLKALYNEIQLINTFGILHFQDFNTIFMHFIKHRGHNKNWKEFLVITCFAQENSDENKLFL